MLPIAIFRPFRPGGGARIRFSAGEVSCILATSKNSP
jgi:hypothetical protein